MARVEADCQRNANTQLIALPQPAFAARDINFYLKDISNRITIASEERYQPTYYDVVWAQNKAGCCLGAQQRMTALMQP